MTIFDLVPAAIGVPTPAEDSFFRMSVFAQAHPAFFLRQVREDGTSDFLSGVCVGDVDDAEQAEQVALDVQEQAYEFERELSNEYAYYWDYSSVPNARFKLSCGSDEWECQTYTVQSGTHEGKRLIKVRNSSGRMRAVAFLNRDATITPWSAFAGEVRLMAALRVAMRRWSQMNFSWMSNLGAAEMSNGSMVQCEGMIEVSECLRCSASCDEGQQLCSEHAPPDDISITMERFDNSPGARRAILARQAEEQRQRVQQEREAREAQREQERRDAAEARDRAARERAEEALANHRTLLSELGTGAVR